MENKGKEGKPESAKEIKNSRRSEILRQKLSNPIRYKWYAGQLENKDLLRNWRGVGGGAGGVVALYRKGGGIFICYKCLWGEG